MASLQPLEPDQTENEPPFRLGDEQFRILVEGVQDYAIFMLDPEGRVVTWNAGAERVKGYTANEIIGSHFGRFYLPEDLARNHPQEVLETALRTGRYEEEGWRVRRDGSRFWANVVLTPLYDRGRLTGFAKVTRDLTALREAEAAAQRLHQAETARAEAERTADTLRNLQAISEAALAHPTLDRLLPAVLERVRQVMQVDTAAILLLEGAVLCVRGAVGFAGFTYLGCRTSASSGFAGRVVRESRPVILDRAPADQADGPILRQRGVRSLLGVPLLVDGRVIGVLHVGMVTPHRFTQEQAAFLQLVADRAALAIENARLYRESREAEERLLLLAEASSALLPSVDAESTVPTLLGLAQRLLKADAYAVWQRDRSSGVWRIVAQSNLSDEYARMEVGSEAPLPDRPFCVPDVLAEPTAANRREQFQRERIRSVLCCPLWVRGEGAGSIVFYQRTPHSFTDSDLRLTGALSSLASSAMTTAELYEDQRRLQAQTEEARIRLAFLAEASRILASSLDYEDTLKRLADLLVPHLADWCTVHLIGEDGVPRPVAVSHADPEKLAWARTVPPRPFDPEAPRGLSSVLRTGKPELYPEVSDALLVQWARDPQELEIFRRIDVRSCMIVPLKVRDRVLGGITLISAESGGRYDEAALTFAEDLARRAADAIDNAQLYRDAQTALEQARHSAARAQRLIESNIIGLQVGKPGGPIREANDAFLQLVGRSRAELENGSLRWEELVAPDYRAVAQEAQEQLRVAGYYTPFELELQRPDGLRVPVLVGAAHFEDRTDDAVTFVLDLTEQRRLAEGVRYAMEHAHCLLWHAYVESGESTSQPLNWSIQLFDPQAAQRFLPLQLEPGESYVDAFYRHKPPEDQQRCNRTAQAAFESNRPGYEQEFRCERADGALRWLQERTYLEQIGPGRWRAVGVCTDITQRKELEEELRRRLSDLAEADRRKDAFLAMLAHELRNPLGAVSNAVYLLEQPAQSETSRGRALRVLKRQITHQTRMVDDLLDVSRLQRGLLELRPTRLDLLSLLTETAEDWRSTMEQEGIRLSREAPRGPLWVQGNPTRLAQVIDNLLSNAVKFTGNGGRIRVQVETANEVVKIHVSDTGAGIDARLLPHIFETFTQANRTLARSRGGLGLGLAIVRGIAELHGGSVAAASEGPGKGATITVCLPLLTTADGIPAAPPEPISASGSHRILIIEDNRDAAETLRDILETDGHVVEVAYSGAAGVEAARRFRPEVVLCDIGLPGMDGFAVADSLRGDPSLVGVHLIAVTGYGQEEDRRRTRKAGFEAHLTKPLDIPELQRLLALL